MDYNGLLLVDKPAGWTSHDVVAKLRGHLQMRKIGHGGTLDPSATGLLVILLGRGTKLSDAVMGGDKTYLGTLRLGITTDSQDLDGDILTQAPWQHITPADIQAQVTSLTGTTQQIPPMVSAIKINGQRLYKAARRGEDIPREPRTITITRFELTHINLPDASFTVTCSKGTYVRTLAHDIGHNLGCGATLTALRRTHSGTYTIQNAQPLATLLATPREQIAQYIIPIG